MPRIVLHLGGNGHASTRLDQAQAALARVCPGLSLVDLAYPGFEGRPRATSRNAFLDSLARSIRSRTETTVAAYASGIGALIALALRARGELAGTPLILQGPVLWGLKDRAFPKVMRRLPFARSLLKMAFSSKAFQGRFARKHFERLPDPLSLTRFFAGYQTCASFGDFFDWFTPGFLLELEQAFANNPSALNDVTIWTGGRDHVVGLADIQATERALGVAWPLKTFPNWGHYPMIDFPEEWADASAGPWNRLDLFDDPSIPKLHNLKTARRAGFAIPETVWAKGELIELCQNMDVIKPPCIVRSGSPTEDTHTTSNAGQLLTLVVNSPADFADSVNRVVAALPREKGRPWAWSLCNR